MPQKAVTAVLLTIGGYYGTLAAARSLGRRGIPIILGDSHMLTPTFFSRFTTRFVRSPSTKNLATLARWLVDFGKRNPGLVLYPTSDDLAWIIATNQIELAKHYRLFQAPESAVYSLLNKQKLYELAASFHLPAPITHFPSSDSELAALGERLTYPVIVKPRTQIGLSVNVKGLICKNAAELKLNVEKYLKSYQVKAEMLAYDPLLKWPMVQQYHQEAQTNTYSLAGFIGQDAATIVVRGAKKVLQQPLTVGVGMAFESRPIQEELKEKVRQLAESIGYFGVFEAEFIHLTETDEYLLMDFNPRFYGQMGFEIARGLPLPQLVYAAAHGEDAEVKKLLSQASEWDHDDLHKFRFSWMLGLLLTTRWLGQKLPYQTRRLWLKWANEGKRYDPVSSLDDRWPFVMDVLSSFIRMIRYPRSSFRNYFL